MTLQSEDEISMRRYQNDQSSREDIHQHVSTITHIQEPQLRTPEISKPEQYEQTDPSNDATSGQKMSNHYRAAFASNPYTDLNSRHELSQAQRAFIKTQQLDSDTSNEKHIQEEQQDVFSGRCQNWDSSLTDQAKMRSHQHIYETSHRGDGVLARAVSGYSTSK